MNSNNLIVGPLRKFYSKAKNTEVVLCREKDNSLTLYKNQKLSDIGLDSWRLVTNKVTHSSNTQKRIFRVHFDSNTGKEIGQSKVTKNLNTQETNIYLKDSSMETSSPIIFSKNPAETSRKNTSSDISILNISNLSPMAKRILKLITNQ